MNVEYFEIKEPRHYLILKRLRNKDIENARKIILKSGDKITLGLSSKIVDDILKLADRYDLNLGIISYMMEFPECIIRIVLQQKGILK